MKIFQISVVALSLCMTSAASAESLKERKANKEATEAFEKVVGDTNTACGTSLKGEINFKSWNVKDTENISRSHCDHGLDQIRSVCGDEEGKKAVKQKIKKYVCKFGAKRAIELKGGTLTYTADKGISLDDFIKEYLMNNL